ncbi:hypothetical protein [Wolbachia sp. wLmal]|uniref:hypothetical protein n=1 Tax=Wolbachia sp. wLmal TaxID=3342489 RepID=UPI003C2B2909
MSINKRETIKKIEGLLFQANGNLEKTCDLLSTVKLTEDDIKILLEEMIKEYYSLFKRFLGVVELLQAVHKMPAQAASTKLIS